MPESIIFKLRETQLNVAPSNQFETIIYMIFNFGFYEIDSNRNRIYIPLTYPTGLKIKPCFWNPKPTYRAKQTRNIEYHSINARLDHLEFLAKKAYRDMINKGLPPSPLSIKKAIDDMDNSKIIVTEKILQYTTRYIREMEDGKGLYNSRRFAIGTIKNYKGLLAQLQEYQRKKARQINWEDITSEFYFDFIRYFSAKNYSPNTIGRHI